MTLGPVEGFPTYSRRMLQWVGHVDFSTITTYGTRSVLLSASSLIMYSISISQITSVASITTSTSFASMLATLPESGSRSCLVSDRKCPLAVAVLKLKMGFSTFHGSDTSS